MLRKKRVMLCVAFGILYGEETRILALAIMRNTHVRICAGQGVTSIAKATYIGDPVLYFFPQPVLGSAVFSIEPWA